MPFDQNIFINCPFDNDYYPILRPLIFTIVYHGYKPRISLENSDSGQPRLEKLKNLISESRYSIHDLSRLQSTKKKEFYRLNMPFELGIDFGCRVFSENDHAGKKFLILEKERYNYMKALSDINGFDIKSHGYEPQGVIKAVRNWFVETLGVRNANSPTVIWYNFTDFFANLFDQKQAEGFTKEEIDYMPIREFVDHVEEWKGNNFH